MGVSAKLNDQTRLLSVAETPPPNTTGTSFPQKNAG